jgi:hypothetical protein
MVGEARSFGSLSVERTEVGVHRLLFVQVEIYSVIPGEQLECIGTLKISNPHVVQLQLSSIPWQIC